MSECEECGGVGEVPVLYDQMRLNMSAEEAVSKAGTIHHWEECPYCNGTGHVVDDEE